jgi:hypothetical protein
VVHHRQLEMTEVFTFAVGVLLVSLPLVLVALAWKSLQWFQAVQVPWRKRVFDVALVGTALGYVWFWVVFLAFPHAFSFESFEKVGRISQKLAFVLLLLSLAGTGIARLFAAAAALGLAVLWLTIGFY